MPPLVVDAGVAIKWVLPEGDSEVAEALLGRFSLIAPELLFAECANVVWKAVRRGDFTPAEGRKIASRITTFAVTTVAIRELVPTAVDISLRLDHPAYDCLYLALSSLQDCQFVTADAKLWRKVTELRGRDAERCLLLSSFS